MRKLGAKMNTVTPWRAAMATDPGLLRSNNEDRVYVDETAGLFLVVDGVGGHAAGEKAAELAIQTIPREMESRHIPMEELVRNAITCANNEIYQLSQSNEEYRGMACVLTLAVAQEDTITFGHVGDSRLYLVWNGAVRKLTSDHSWVGELEDQGTLSEAGAMNHPRRNEVFRDVGSRLRESTDEGFIETKSFPFHPDAALLLCSDGLSDALTSAEIGAIAEQYDGDPESVVRLLIEAANEAGGRDNISVIFVAGPEFLGSASRSMAEARTRHAVTRMRRSSRRWRYWAERFGWLIAGMILGAIAWVLIERTIGRSLLPR